MREIKFRAWDNSAKQMLVVGQIKNNTKSVAENGDVLMQFTGFLDKYKRGIFEGDIIKDAHGRISAVYWNSTLSGYILKPNLTHLRDECLLGLTSTVLEIIGNIYENPELLKGGEKCST